jgi:predicted transcriptional regulator
MSSNNRRTILEDLSTELFFEIFDFFHFIELYHTFSNLNRRIDDYLVQLSNICLKIYSEKYELTTTLTEKHLLSIRSIKFNTNTWVEEDDHKLEEFFIQYPLNSFQKLRSLTLRSIISSTELPVIIKQLPLLSNLTFLNIEFFLFRPKLTANELRRAH